MVLIIEPEIFSKTYVVINSTKNRGFTQKNSSSQKFNRSISNPAYFGQLRREIYPVLST